VILYLPANFYGLLHAPERRIHYHQEIDITLWAGILAPIRTKQDNPLWFKFTHNLADRIVDYFK